MRVRPSRPRHSIPAVLAAACALGVVPQVLLPAARAEASAPEGPKESWSGVYFNTRKIGYAHITSAPTTYQGKPAYRMTSSSKTHIELFGQSVSQESEENILTDAAYRPIHQEVTILSNGSRARIVADYGPNKVVCLVDSTGKPVRKEIAIPAGADLSADPTEGLPGQKLKAGEKVTVYFLEPLSVSLQKSDIRVEAERQVVVDGRTCGAFRVLATSPMGNLTSWESEDGDMLQGVMSLGAISMEIFQETKDQALDMKRAEPRFAVLGATAAEKAAYTPPHDFLLATAVTADKPIPSPRLAKHLSLVIDGIQDAKLALSDTRQHVQPVTGKATAYAVTISAVRFDPAKSVRLPITDPALKADLQPAPYLDFDDPKITAIASQLKGSDTNAFRVAQRIHDWVHAHMTPDYTIGVPRSCAEINGKRKGVCRDYATIFAGIARAAGIPTRLCAGIVYADGRFFYHAWAECWVGQWVPFDATMSDSSFVDATHIKFAQGDVTDMYQATQVVGRISARVLQVQ